MYVYIRGFENVRSQRHRQALSRVLETLSEQDDLSSATLTVAAETSSNWLVWMLETVDKRGNTRHIPAVSTGLHEEVSTLQSLLPKD